MEKGLKINFLDHVAIRVKDVQKSIEWYEPILNLEKYQFPEWGEYPIMMFAGKSGVAIFPAELNDTELPLHSKNIKIDHFAFNVDKSNFKLAQNRFDELGIAFKYQDHHYFESIYIQDPDGHTVELTTLKVNFEGFYKL